MSTHSRRTFDKYGHPFHDLPSLQTAWKSLRFVLHPDKQTYDKREHFTDEFTQAQKEKDAWEIYYKQSSLNFNDILYNAERFNTIFMNSIFPGPMMFNSTFNNDDKLQEDLKNKETQIKVMYMIFR